MMNKLQGIIPPMVTPLLANDTIDVEGTKRLVDHLIAGGVHGIFILGTTGEAQSLSYACRYEFIELVSKQIAGRVPLLVCITDTSVAESIALAAKAKECGAVGVVAAAPYYFAAAQQELIEYYSYLADNVCLPLYLYNMPSHVKVFLEAKTVAKLAEHPNIVGLKDSSANMTYFESLIYLLRDKPEFGLYVGPEEITAEAVMLGANGGINGGANMFPELYVSMYNAAKANDLAKVLELQKRIMAISTSLYGIGKYGSSYLKGVKCALSVLGICNGYLSWPYREFRSEERAKVAEALNQLGEKI